MLAVRVTVIRYVSDEPQPGLVEFHLEDALGHLWRFVDKTAIVSTMYLDADSVYPQAGTIAVEEVGRGRDAAGLEVVRIDTERHGIESVDGTTRFDVLPSSLLEV